MVLEIVDITVKQDMDAAFEAGVAQAVDIFRQAPGFVSLSLVRSVERPQAYRLLVQWETLEDHVPRFQQSSGFLRWRELVGHCFAQPPAMDHNVEVVRS